MMLLGLFEPVKILSSLSGSSGCLKLKLLKMKLLEVETARSETARSETAQSCLISSPR